MTPAIAIFVITAIAINALASLWLKHAAIQTMEGAITSLPTKVLALGGTTIFFYAVPFVVYAMVLRTLPISQAYTSSTFGFRTVLILAGILFCGERHGPMAWVHVHSVKGSNQRPELVSCGIYEKVLKFEQGARSQGFKP